MHSLLRHSDARFLPLIAAAMLCGCASSERSQVTGRVVRHDGTPLVGATVTARSQETGRWASGVTDVEGAFTLGTQTPGEGLPPGEYYVVVQEDRGDMDQRPATIPQKYGKPSASGLTLTVEAGRSATLEVTLDAV